MGNNLLRDRYSSSGGVDEGYEDSLKILVVSGFWTRSFESCFSIFYSLSILYPSLYHLFFSFYFPLSLRITHTRCQKFRCFFFFVFSFSPSRFLFSHDTSHKSPPTIVKNVMPAHVKLGFFLYCLCPALFSVLFSRNGRIATAGIGLLGIYGR